MNPPRPPQKTRGHARGHTRARTGTRTGTRAGTRTCTRKPRARNAQRNAASGRVRLGGQSGSCGPWDQQHHCGGADGRATAMLGVEVVVRVCSVLVLCKMLRACGRAYAPRVRVCDCIETQRTHTRAYARSCMGSTRRRTPRPMPHRHAPSPSPYCASTARPFALSATPTARW